MLFSSISNGIPRTQQKRKATGIQTKPGRTPGKLPRYWCGTTYRPPRATLTAKSLIPTLENLKWLIFTTPSAIHSHQSDYATSAGTAVSTAGFGAQTYFVSLTAPARRQLRAASDFSSARQLLSRPSPAHFAVQLDSSRQSQSRRATLAVSNDGVGGTLVVVELTN